MARYSLIPVDGTLVVDGIGAFGVDYTGIDPTIHAVQWYDTIGDVEYVKDPITGAGPANQTITDFTPYMSYVNQAIAIIEAFQNPLVVYSTQDSVLVQGVTYNFGAEITITTVGAVPPVGTTESVPPTPEDFQKLYWYNDAWIVSAFDPILVLADAKTSLISKIETSAAEQADLQARIYSQYQLLTSVNPGTLVTADYPTYDLSSYQAYLDTEVSSMSAEVNAATTTEILYSFDWRVDGNPAP